MRAPPIEAELAAHKPTDEEKIWALAAHLGPLILSFIAPLVVLLTKGVDSKWVRAQAVEALNFQISVIGAFIASFVLSLVVGLIPLIGIIAVGFVCVQAAVGLGWLVFTVLGGVKAYGGEQYRYPVNLRLVK